MPKSTREIPPPLELLCLKTLWLLEEGSVTDVRRVVSESRPLAYTTIMTVLDRLVRKGIIDRRKVGRAFVYVPRASRDAMRRIAVRELIDCFFDGSEDQLLSYLQQGVVREPSARGPSELDGAGIDTVLL